MKISYRVFCIVFYMLLIAVSVCYGSEIGYTNSADLADNIKRDIYPAFTNGSIAKQSLDSISVDSAGKNLFDISVSYHHNKTASNVFGTIVELSKDEWFFGYCMNIYKAALKYNNKLNYLTVIDLDSGDKSSIKVKDCILINNKKLTTAKSLNMFKSKIIH